MKRLLVTFSEQHFIDTNQPYQRIGVNKSIMFDRHCEKGLHDGDNLTPIFIMSRHPPDQWRYAPGHLVQNSNEV